MLDELQFELHAVDDAADGGIHGYAGCWRARQGFKVGDRGLADWQPHGFLNAIRLNRHAAASRPAVRLLRQAGRHTISSRMFRPKNSFNARANLRRYSWIELELIFILRATSSRQSSCRKMRSTSPRRDRKFAVRNLRPTDCRCFRAALSPSSPRRRCSGFRRPLHRALSCSQRLIQSV